MRAFLSVFAALTISLFGLGAPDAGTFGGFSANSTRYLERPNRICKPVPKSKPSSTPSCVASAPTAIARASFRLGTKLAGASAAYRSSLAGNSITLWTKAGKRVFSFASMEMIDRVVATYLSKTGTMIAIEYEVRSMGRTRTQVLGVLLSTGLGIATTTTTTTTTAATTKPIPLPPSVAGPKLSKKQKRNLKRYLRLARINNRRRRFRTALKWIERAEKIDANNPQAKFRRAVRLAGKKQDSQLIAHVAKMARSGRATGARWWLEVRFHKAFKRMWVNKAFRVATGMDESIKRVRTTYETLLGYGGHWEQSGKSCQREQINLRLNRHNSKFRLVIQSKCGRDDWITKLDGRFGILERRRTIVLTFPNPRRKASVVRIRLGTCKGYPKEVCLKTSVAGMKMILLSVRR